MHTVVVDIETNWIEDWRDLSDLKKIHCLVVRSGDTVRVYNSHSGEIRLGLLEIEMADMIVGHNLTRFDIPALQKFYPDFNPQGCIRDTLTMARLVWPDTKNDDFKRREFPRHLIGMHSLEAWGHRLGEHKGSYGVDTPEAFDEWSQPMVDYCIQDTLVTHRLYQAIEREQPSEKSVILEHDFASIIQQQERHGFRFNVKAAKNLHADLLDRKAELESDLQKIFPAAEIPMKTPQYWKAGGEQYPTKGAAKKAGFKDAAITKGPLRVKQIPFNPGSRDQIAQQLIRKYGWEPKHFTGEGKPKIDESILNALKFEEAKTLVSYLTVSKRLGQLAEGREAWLKSVEGDRIYGRVNPNGAVSGRCTHSRPNLSAVPAISSPYGRECRGLFIPDSNHVLVGCDASGLELRMLAHYLAFADGGKYAKLVTTGDPHAANQKAAGLPTRDAAKTFIYALIYGSGDQNLGSLVNGGVKEGKQLRKKFMSAMPAFKKLKAAIDHTVSTKGYLTGLDGRRLPVRSKHSSLNLLLQSAGAIAMKVATVQLRRALHSLNLDREPENQVRQVAMIHDELQISCPREVSDEVGKAACRAIVSAGEILELHCSLGGEFAIGASWAETH